MSAYKEYLKGVKKYADDNKGVISQVNKSDSELIFPQHILWAKTVCEYLETDKAKTLRIKDGFYFTEQLVNKLMLFAFLKGRNDVEEKSYENGWHDCEADIANKLGFADNTNNEKA